MERFVPKSKSDQKWLDNLNCYMDYLHEFMVSYNEYNLPE